MSRQLLPVRFNFAAESRLQSPGSSHASSWPAGSRWGRWTPWILFLILLLAAGLRFWNVTHDADLTYILSGDALKKFSLARLLVLEGRIPPEAIDPASLYRQPMFLIRSFAVIWKGFLFLGFTPDDVTMRVGFNSYQILMSLAVVIFVYKLGRLVSGRPEIGLLAALLFAVFPVNVMGSLYVKEDIPLMFWFTAALVPIAALAGGGSVNNYLWGGLLTGLAIGAKYTGVLIIPLFFIAHLVAVFDTESDRRWRRFFHPAAVATPLLILIGFLIFNRQVFDQWPSFWEGLRYQVDYAAGSHHDGTIITGRDYWWLFYLRYAIWPGVSPPVTVFMLTGLLLAFINKNRPAMLLAVAVVVYYFLFENSPAKPFPFFARYLHPLYPLLAVLAAYAFGILWEKLADRQPPSGRFFPLTLGLILVLYPLATSLIVAGGTRPDTRTTAAAWIENNLPPGAKIYMGSRTYSPQSFDRDRFQVEYVGRIHEKPLDTLRAEEVDFLVVSSFDTERYTFSMKSSDVSRTAVDAYRQIEQTLPLVAQFRPALAVQTYGQSNPIIEIYELPN